MHESGRVERAILVIDHLDQTSPLGKRLEEAYRHTGEWGATGAATSTPTTLSGTPGTEHRQPFETASQRLLVFRYVQQGDSLFAAWVSGTAAEMKAREAENAAWLDAVRFDDLTPPK